MAQVRRARLTPAPRSTKLKGLLWLGLALAVGVALAGGLAPLARIIPWSWERRLGAWIERGATERPLRADQRSEAALGRIVARLYPLDPEDRRLPITVRLVRSRAVNAYAGLGGAITLNSALVAKAESPEEVAGVLAHEIAHVRRRHVLRGLFARVLNVQGVLLVFGGGTLAGDLTEMLLNMEFTRAQEAQADADGLARLAAAHVDHDGLRRFFERLEKDSPDLPLLSDHPAMRDRAARVGRTPQRDVRPILAGPAWTALRNACRDAAPPR